jgi:nucleoside-diphosphate-sugar epimerase
MNPEQSTHPCIVTGPNGFVGGRLREFLAARGFPLAAWSRQPTAEPHGLRFQLGQTIHPGYFAATSGLIHCAYDFSARRWDEIATVNVRGSEQLFRAARQAGVKRLVFISSLSAFAGCRSLYGKAKLEIERIALDCGAMVIRPGLVYGDQPGGLFGGLVRQVRRARVVPLLGGGQQPQYLVHVDDLGELIRRYLIGEVGGGSQPITLAHEKPWPMRELLGEIGQALDREVRFVAIPWRPAWLGLKSLELLGLPAPFRSDSLIGYIYQNQHPDFTPARRLHAECRPFRVNAGMLG